MKFQKRSYRNAIFNNRLVHFQITVKETDLMIRASHSLESDALELVLAHRGYLENYIELHPDFLKTLVPWRLDGPAPAIIRDMSEAGGKAGVGPMAAVAGALSEIVGRGLLKNADEVIVENGGDTFFKTEIPVIVGIYAGKSPLSMNIGLRVDSRDHPVALCTSSGTIGHSLSFGKADAVCVMSDSCALADAAATAVGNRVRSSGDISEAIHFGKSIQGVTGLVVIIGRDMGMWGDIEVTPLRGKKY